MTDLAEAADIETRYLQEIERARANVTILVLVAIAEALELDERELLKTAKLTPARPGRPPKRA